MTRGNEYPDREHLRRKLDEARESRFGKEPDDDNAATDEPTGDAEHARDGDTDDADG